MATRHATQQLESRLQANPDSLVFSRLADCYLGRGETDRAIETCLKGVNLHPLNTTGRMVLGRCLIKKERFAEAIGVFAEVCRLDERNAMAMKILGDLFARHGSGDLAGDLYRLAARLDPFDAPMATVAARAIGSGKTDLLDIIEEGVADTKAAKLTGTPSIEKSEKAEPEAAEVLETIESKIDAAPDASGEETFDIVETGESEPLVAEPAEETIVRTETKPLPTVAAEPSGNAPAGSEPVEIFSDDSAITEEVPAAGLVDSPELVLDAEAPGALPLDAEVAAAPGAAVQPSAAPIVAEMPSGQEISSRLDTLFGEESPASRGAALLTPAHADALIEDLAPLGDAVPMVEESVDRLIVDMPTEETALVNDRVSEAAPAMPEAAPAIPEPAMETLIIDEPGESPLDVVPPARVTPGEHEELFLDSRDELLVEEGDNQERLSPVDSHGAERLIIDEPPAGDGPRPAVERPGDRLSHAEPAFGGLEIATPTLAEIYFKQGQLHQALAIYRRLYDKEPGNVSLQKQIETVEAAIASGGEGIASTEQERGKASRKSAEEPVGLPGTPPTAAEPAPGAKPKAKTNFKWIKKPQ